MRTKAAILLVFFSLLVVALFGGLFWMMTEPPAPSASSNPQGQPLSDPDTNALMYVHEHDCSEIAHEKESKRFDAAKNSVEINSAFSAYKCSGIDDFIFVHFSGGVVR